jgi:hypothetical protein
VNDKEQGGSNARSRIVGPTANELSRAQVLRESITALLSLAIAAVALWMLVDTYVTGRGPALVNEAYARQKDLLLYALALLGTVTGYYLGRVPAELHAQNAEREAKQAQDEQVRTKRRVRSAIRQIKANVTAGEKGSGVRHAGPDQSAEPNVVEDLDRLLTDLED